MNQAEKDESFLPALEDEAIEVECLLVEPKNDHVSVDGIFDFDMESSKNSMSIEVLPCKFGEMDSNSTQEGEDDIEIQQEEEPPNIWTLEFLREKEERDRELVLHNQRCMVVTEGTPQWAKAHHSSQKASSSSFLLSYVIMKFVTVPKKGRWLNLPPFKTLQVLDVMPYEADEVGNLQAGNGISSTCEDYLLDIEFAESVPKLDCNSSEGLHSGNSGPEHQVPGFSRSDNGTLGMPKSSTAITPMLECQDDSLEKAICELHGVFSSKCVCKTPVNDKMWLQVSTSFHLQNVDKLEDFTNFLGRGISSNEKEKDMIFTPGLTSGSILCTTTILQNDIASSGDESVEQESPSGKEVSTKSPAEASKVDALLTEKRLRKPTRRYIEESSDLNSRSSRRRQEVSTSTSKDKFAGVRFHRHHHMGSRAMTLTPEESFRDAGSQVLFGSQVHRDCLKKHASTVGPNSDDEPSSAESEDDCITTLRSENCGGQRKHHRSWNISEVRKLIDGVSKYGVGRWTAIKRLLFSSSAHRTPVDLKDKWRNLLRASYSLKQSKREDEQDRKHAWRPLPNSVLHRVSELALVHPYPRDRKSKLSCVSSRTLPPNRRIVGTRNCT